ncbi:L-threonylcarbamoyladenylate synthase [Nematocida major]|uniref:L-threonylcarbamoyladenylate synthase n=1 Tax=Nematocida major TaxID=1912982 RepID=UPI002008713B|nr:L-threonylcarbamoyladenylate synthase [Nematocida major]KAH9385692.1 L-threonylcarbamoyladenylate synthase [Nematocida major]
MHAQIVPVEGNLEKISAAFQEGPVAFPTETVYGLGAIAWREDLIQKVFAVKNRPMDNPLIVHVSSLEMLRRCISGEIPKVYAELIDAFWPGPLTLLFPRSTALPDSVTAGSDFVAVRMPNHRDTLLLIDHLGEPIVGPSANKSTRPSPTTAQHVFEDLGGEISLIVDGGSCEEGVESTVVNALCSPPLFLRPGVISYEAIQEFVPALELLSSADTASGKMSPGTRYKHYSPSAAVTMLTGSPSEIEEKIERVREESAGLLVPERYAKKGGNLVVYSLGESAKTAAQRVFDGLRFLDRRVSKIYTAQMEVDGEGRAVMDRLTRAASHWM